MTNTALIDALWSLKEDTTWAYKQALEGREPDMKGLEDIFERIRKLVEPPPEPGYGV